MTNFTHYDVEEKDINMVDISGKGDVFRRATASGKIKLREETIKAIKEGEVEKGDVLTTAKIAAIEAIKDTPSIIPMCHPIQITGSDVGFEVENNSIKAEVTVKTTGKTGVEMEALTGLSVSLLTIWDMVKSAEKDNDGQYPKTKIYNIKVTEKIKDEKKSGNDNKR